MVGIISVVFQRVNRIQIGFCSFVPEYTFKNSVVPVPVAKIFVRPGIGGNHEIKGGYKQVFGFERKFSHKCALCTKINTASGKHYWSAYEFQAYLLPFNE